MRGRSRGCASDAGSSAVEFALILPVLLMILFGIIDFGRLQYERITVTQAAAEGARASAFKKTTDTITAVVQAAAGPLAVTIDTATSRNLSCANAMDTETVVVVKRPQFFFFTPVLRGLNVTPSAQGAYWCLN